MLLGRGAIHRRDPLALPDDMAEPGYEYLWMRMGRNCETTLHLALRRGQFRCAHAILWNGLRMTRETRETRNEMCKVELHSGCRMQWDLPLAVDIWFNERPEAVFDYDSETLVGEAGAVRAALGAIPSYRNISYLNRGELLKIVDRAVCHGTCCSGVPSTEYLCVAWRGRMRADGECTGHYFLWHTARELDKLMHGSGDPRDVKAYNAFRWEHGGRLVRRHHFESFIYTLNISVV